MTTKKPDSTPSPWDLVKAGDTSLAGLVAALREQEAVSVRELARRASVSASQVSRIENGEIKKPSEELLQALAETLGVQPDALLYRAGHIDDEEFAARNLRRLESIDRLALPYRLVEGFVQEDKVDLAVIASIVLPLIYPGGVDGDDGLHTLTNIWRSLTPERARLLLAHAHDQQRLSKSDRLGEGQNPYVSNAELVVG